MPPKPIINTTKQKNRKDLKAVVKKQRAYLDVYQEECKAKFRRIEKEKELLKAKTAAACKKKVRSLRESNNKIMRALKSKKSASINLEGNKVKEIPADKGRKPSRKKK